MFGSDDSPDPAPSLINQGFTPYNGAELLRPIVASDPSSQRE
jgi:hypothetical protein